MHSFLNDNANICKNRDRKYYPLCYLGVICNKLWTLLLQGELEVIDYKENVRRMEA